MKEAQAVLLKALRGEKVDKAQLEAARSLFSFRADQPPSSREAKNAGGPMLTKRGRPVTGLADVLAFGLEIAQEATEKLIATARKQAGAPQAAVPERSESAQADHDAALAESFEELRRSHNGEASWEHFHQQHKAIDGESTATRAGSSPTSCERSAAPTPAS